MADLDEISMLLGQISADIKHVLQWQDRHERADQERFEGLACRIDASNGVRGRIEKVEVLVAEQAVVLDDHKPVIEEVRRLKWMAAALSACVIALAGVAGSVASFAKEWIFN